MRRLKRRRLLQVLTGTVFFPLLTNAREAPMGIVKPPPGIVAFTNYTACAISDTGTWYFACLDKARGCVVWKDGDQQPLLEHPGTQDYGAPSLVWDNTGRLIMCSCNEKGTELLVLPVPGVNKAG